MWVRLTRLLHLSADLRHDPQGSAAFHPSFKIALHRLAGERSANMAEQRSSLSPARSGVFKSYSKLSARQGTNAPFAVSLSLLQPAQNLWDIGLITPIVP